MTASALLEEARRFEQAQAALVPGEDRPLFHLTPPVGWMNDPNGFCFYKGQYHLFYQYHPYSRQWGPMHWGHAVSDDLLRWTCLPCALAPDTEADAGGCFSGTAQPMPDGRLMLVYTGVRKAGDGGEAEQAQCAAFGDGVDFEKYPLNPVVSAAGLPEGYSAADFRDPKIWLEADGVFRMAVANRQADRQGSILLLESADGLNWRFRGELDSSREQLGRMWECPDFFRLDGITIQEETALPGVTGRLLDLALTARPVSAPCRLTVALARDRDHRLTVELDFARRELLLDRSGDGTCQDIAHIRRVGIEPRDGQCSLRIILDKESCELFLNGGEKVLTVRLFSPRRRTASRSHPTRRRAFPWRRIAWARIRRRPEGPRLCPIRNNF